MDYELTFWLVCGIASLIFLIALYIAGKRNYGCIEWIRDWNECR